VLISVKPSIYQITEILIRIAFKATFIDMTGSAKTTLICYQ